MMPGNGLKKYLTLAVLIFLTSCTVSKKNGPTEAFPGAEESRQTTETEEEANGGGEAEVPPADVGNETAEESETCEPPEFLTLDIPDVTAGEEELEAQIMTRGACGFVTCVLVEGPEWVSVDNCQVHGFANTAESLGEHTLIIRAQNMRNEEEFVDRLFNLVVRDEPKINLFVSSSDSDALKQNVIQKDVEDFAVTLGHNTLYAKVEGYAEEYDVPPLADGRLVINLIEGKLYSISLADENNRPSPDDEFVITAQDEHDNRTERTFRVTFTDDPCDQRFEIKPYSVVKFEDGSVNYESVEISGTDIPVTLGSKYRIVFQMTGGIGPYEWSEPISEVWPRITSDIPIPSDYQTLRTNESWEKVEQTDPTWGQGIRDNLESQITEEALEKNAYYQLKTEFVFSDKEIPWYFGLIDTMPPNDVYDRLTIEVADPSCRSQNGEAKKASYVLDHHFRLPTQLLSDVTCEQEITDVADTGSDSAMFINFIIGDNEYRAGVTGHGIDQCVGAENEHYCEDPSPVYIDNTYRNNSNTTLDEITGIEIHFQDYTNYDHFCGTFDSCDHDQADYDLIRLTCSTPFQSFTYWDSEHGHQMDDNVVPPEDGGIGASLDRGTGGLDSMQHRIYQLIPPGTERIWKPRPRPDYPTLAEE